MILQIFLYKDVFYNYNNRQFPFYLGMISSTSKPNEISVEEFYVFIDISRFLNDPVFTAASSGRRKRSAHLDKSLFENRVSLTRFTVSPKTLCWASLTTELGRITMNFRYGELVSRNENVFLKNISTSGDNIFVLYEQTVANVTFHCSCIIRDLRCGGKNGLISLSFIIIVYTSIVIS